MDGHTGNPKGDGAEQSPARGTQSHRLLSTRSAEQLVSSPAPLPTKECMMTREEYEMVVQHATEFGRATVGVVGAKTQLLAHDARQRAKLVAAEKKKTP